MMSIKWLNLGFGKIVEIKGNVVLIDGCQFSVCSPEITTAFKRHFFFDNYEADERHALKHFLDPRLPVIELGGALGVIACLTNKRLNYPEKHVVVEANPGIIPLLKENCDRNNCQFTILNRAVAYGTDEVTFNVCDDFWASSIQASFDKSVIVQTVSLNEIINEYGFEQFTLICDIEGGEIDLVKFDKEVLRDRVATLIIEVHENIVGAEPVNNMLRDLEKLNFNSVYTYGSIHVLQKQNNQLA
jgi:FkbM family methyltransferase